MAGKISNREIEILNLIAYEYSSREIAERLFLSFHTVDSHKKNLKAKLDVRNTAGMVRRGFELGILHVNASTRIALYLVIFTFSLQSTPLITQNPFILTFETANVDEKVVIPIQSGFNYDYSVDWGDGSALEVYTTEASHTYVSPGQYSVQITGKFPSIYYNGSSQALKLIEIKQWGDIKWESMRNAFHGAANLKISPSANTPSTAPDLSIVTDMTGTFKNCSSLTEGIKYWDVAGITTMASMLEGATSFNGAIGDWQTTSLTSLLLTFSGASSFNQEINDWDVSNVTNFVGTFKNAISFNKRLADWNTSSATLMGAMFEGASSFNQYVGSWNVSGVFFMNKMFLNASSFNRSIKLWEIPNVTNLEDFLVGSNFGPSNYDDLLIYWSANPRQDDVTLEVGNFTFCNASFVKENVLIGESNWTIQDGGKDCDRPFIFTYRTLTDNEEVTYSFPTLGNNYYVDWENDGIVDDTICRQLGNVSCTHIPTHIYPTAGDHQIAISGVFLHFPNGTYTDETFKNQTVAINQWGSIEWEYMSYLGVGSFSDMPNLEYFANDHPNLNNVTSCQNLFKNCALFDGEIGDWDVSNVENMNSMFEGTSIFNGDLSLWDVSNVTNMDSMFRGSSAFDSNISSWNVSNVTSFANMYQDAISFNQPIGLWNTEKAMNMSSMFWGANSFNQDLSNWNVELVTDFSSMFFGADAFNGNLSGWNTTAAENMFNMFGLADSFNQPISHFNTSSVVDLSYMFRSANVFNQDLSSWNVSNVTTFEGMFSGARNFNGRLDGWITSAAANMSDMFSFANSFNQPVGHFQTGGVTDMSKMFWDADVFNQELTNWNTTLVGDMSYMFARANEFDQDLSLWNVRGVNKMDSIFYRASNFDHSLGDWDILNVTSMRNALSISGISRANYDATLTGWGEDWLSLQMDVELGVAGLEYCDGEPYRERLVFLGWNIDGDQRNCDSTNPGPCTVSTPNNYIGPDLGDWNTAVNWSRGEVPNECDIVSIGLDNQVLLSADAQCYTLDIFPGSSLIVNGHEIIVIGIISN